MALKEASITAELPNQGGNVTILLDEDPKKMGLHIKPLQTGYVWVILSDENGTTLNSHAKKVESDKSMDMRVVFFDPHTHPDTLRVIFDRPEEFKKRQTAEGGMVIRLPYVVESENSKGGAMGHIHETDQTDRQTEQGKVFNPELYIISADRTLIHCVDERQHVEDETNGVEIPGGIYGLLDAIKTIKHISETEARTLVVEAGIPIGAHVDDHHGEKGCGYAKLVENSPEIVGAPESVSAQDRLAWVQSVSGLILHYTGEHKPTHAVINRRAGYSIDPDQAFRDGFRVFNCDTWFAGEVAEKLGIDKQLMIQTVEDMYRKTVTALSGITDFIEIK